MLVAPDVVAHHEDAHRRLLVQDRCGFPSDGSRTSATGSHADRLAPPARNRYRRCRARSAPSRAADAPTDPSAASGRVWPASLIAPLAQPCEHLDRVVLKHVVPRADVEIGVDTPCDMMAEVGGLPVWSVARIRQHLGAVRHAVAQPFAPVTQRQMADGLGRERRAEVGRILQVRGDRGPSLVESAFGAAASRAPS